MSETILAVIIGGVLGIVSTVIALVFQTHNERFSRRLATMRNQIAKLSQTVNVLLDVEDALLDRLTPHESVAKRTLKKEIRDAVGGEGISASLVSRSELLKINTNIPVSMKVEA